MLKQTITYEDFNGEEQTDTLFFNLTKAEMMDLFDIKPQLEAWVEKTSGPQRELSVSEIREFLGIIKYLVEKSYGVKSDDGKRFVKTPELFQEFQQSAAYDTFLFSLFEKIENATGFMVNIMPKGIISEAEIAAAVQGAPAPTLSSVPSPSEDEKPAERKLEDYSHDELVALPQAEFDRLAGTNPKSWSRDTMLVAFERKNRA